MTSFTHSVFLTWEALWAAGAIAMLFALYPIAIRLQPSRRKSRSDGLNIIYDPSEADPPQNPQFEIVAVHGLGAHPDHTWEGKPVKKDCPKPYLLGGLLSDSFPTARILSFAYNSDWLVDAPEKTAQQIGKSLLEKVVKHRGDLRLPIIFMGHSFGGIVIKEALCAAEESSNILKDTCGIIFLGTPHQGSSLSTAGAFLSQLTGFLGSNTTLLLALRSRGSQLSDLELNFRNMIADTKLQRKIVSFYETKPTLMLGWLSVGLVVDRDSATGYSANPTAIDTDHSGLNKFNCRDHPGYRALEDAVNKLREKSLLEQADDHLCKKHYTDEALKIERLSGDPLSLDQCYINLAIVKQTKTNTSARDRSGGDDSVPRSSPFSLLARQKVDTLGEHAQLHLTDIFNRRKISDDTEVSPRRILIRGRAGVGKTTLCKKMVYDFTRNKMWSKLFDHVLWVPLRNLKQRVGTGYDLKKLFDDEYFQFSGEDKKADGTGFAKELYQALAQNRTLFILDGWDEVAGTDNCNDISMLKFLCELLSQSNVIITSRPSAALPQGIKVDLELETIGFSPEQVDVYIDKVHGEKVDELRAFLQTHKLVRSLVRIPIQLDAFCYCWNDIGSGREKKLDTMTTLYQAIETSLWRKDAVRLERMTKESSRTASRIYVEDKVGGELQFLEHMAFAGLAADKIEFGLDNRNAVHDYLKLSFPLDRNLQRLSFVRTSDPSAQPEHQLYHFIHLTFQEYFAARYFVRQWIANPKMENVTFRYGGSVMGISPVDFLKKHKYDAGYDIMWRFVAGLLDAVGKRQTSRFESSGSVSHDYDSAGFFEEIENEPVDLLGPTHQRLVMHCLREAMCLPREIRASREERLADWVLFESDYTGSSELARESELPDQVLRAALSRSQGKRILLNELVYSGRYLSQMVVSDLVDLFKDEDSDVRSSAANVVGKQPTLSETTIIALVDLLKDEDSDVRSSAADAIGNQSTLSETTMIALVDLLKDEDRYVRSSAADTVGNQSTLSETTMIALMDLFKHEDSDVRSSAAEVVGKQSTLSETTMIALMDLLKDKDSDVRSSAANVVGKQPTLSDTTMIALVGLFKHENSDVRYSAADTVGKQSTLSDTTVIALVDLLKDEDFRIQRSAVDAIGRQPTLSDTTVIALIDLLKDEDFNIQRSAVDAIGKQPILSDTTMIALVDLFKHEDNDVRYSAAEAVGEWPDLMDKVLDASGLLIQSTSHPDKQASHTHHLHYIEPLYMSLLRRGFAEQFSLYRGDDLLTINQSSGLRTAALEKEDLLQVWIRNGRFGLKASKGYNLWEPLVGSGSNQLVEVDVAQQRM